MFQYQELEYQEPVQYYSWKIAHPQIPRPQMQPRCVLKRCDCLSGSLRTFSLWDAYLIPYKTETSASHREFGCYPVFHTPYKRVALNRDRDVFTFHQSLWCILQAAAYSIHILCIFKATYFELTPKFQFQMMATVFRMDTKQITWNIKVHILERSTLFYSRGMALLSNFQNFLQLIS